MQRLLLLLLLGAMVQCQRGQNWQSRDYYKNSYGQQKQSVQFRTNEKAARKIYYMDDLSRHVQAVPKNMPIKADPSTARIVMQIQLRYYKDPNKALPNGQTCYYQPRNGNQNSNSTIFGGSSGATAQNCRFMFTLLITGPSNTVDVYASGPVPLNSDGSVDLTKLYQWQTSKVLGYNLKPMSIDILVHHFGNVVDKSGVLLSYGTLVHVDSFTQSLISVTPAVAGTNLNQKFYGLTGVSLGTKLNLNIGLKCGFSGQVGPNCDLICNSVPNTPSVTICNSTITGHAYVCNTNNTYGTNPGQVFNCSYCQFGATQYGACMTSGASYASSSTRQGVAYGYYVATIVLAIVAGILLIILLAACLLWFWGQKDDSDRSTHNWYRSRGNVDPRPKSSPPLAQGYRPVNTQPDPEWSTPTRTQAGVQRNSLSDQSQNGGMRAPTHPYQNPPATERLPPLAVAETGSRASHDTSSNNSFPTNPARREAAV